MRKALLISLVWIVGTMTMLAGPVSEQRAREVAKGFMLSHMNSLTRSERIEPERAITGVVDTEDAGVYVFNSESGFVIVSGDDSTVPVLGYSNEGPYVAENVPTDLKAMLKAYDYAVKNVTRASNVSVHDAVYPLIRSKWNQGNPFNQQCPLDEEKGELSVTGCAATAMAQVLNYHQYPAGYDWNNMKAIYTGKEDDTDKSAQAVAELMADCGEALFMEYSAEASNAYNFMITEALRINFNYDFSLDYIERSCFSAKAWDEIIYNELNMGRPVIYTGQSVSGGNQGGHAFVIDGYDGNGYYHVNWGWGGFSDGYYLISILNPNVQGTGGNAGSSGYSFSQAAIIGVKPAVTSVEATTRLIQGSCFIQEDKGTYKRSSKSDNFSAIVLNAVLYNAVYPAEKRNYDVEFALYKDGVKIKQLDGGSFSFDYGFDHVSEVYSDPLSLGSDLSDGTYQVHFLCRESGKKDMIWALGSIDRFVELVIDGLTMTTRTYNAFYDQEYKFTVNSVKVSDNNRLGKQMVITANVTSNNQEADAPLYLWGDTDSTAPGVYKLITAAGCNMVKGETGDIVFTFTPQRTGTFNFILSGSSGGDEGVDYGTALYSFEVEVSERSMADVSLDISFSVDGSVKQKNGIGKVNSLTLKGKAKIKNTGTETYDDHITLYLAESASLTENFYVCNGTSAPVVIPVNQTEEVPFHFDVLNSGHYYAVLVMAVEKGEMKYISLKDGKLDASSIFLISGTDGIDAIVAEGADADVYNLQGVYLGKASELDRLPRGLYIINGKKQIVK